MEHDAPGPTTEFCGTALAEIKEIKENPPMPIVKTTDDFYSEIRKGNPLVACFQATWCGDCHFLKPAYLDLEAEFSGRVEFHYIDIDELPDIARAHEVTGIPSFILFSSGRETFRLVNPRRKTKEEVTDFLEKGLALIPRSKENT